MDVSKCFSHFCRQIGINDRTFKNLRKTNITYIDSIFANKTHEVTDHSGMKVLKDSYIALDLKRMRVKNGLGIFKDNPIDYNMDGNTGKNRPNA